MSEEVVEVVEANEVLTKVANYFTADEWAIMFNGVGEINIKLNSKEAQIFSKLRDKIKVLHEKATEATITC